MRKHEHHNNWDLNECVCRRTDYESMANSLHQEYTELKSTVLDLLQSLDAEDQLKKGFNGMGHNIMTETASKKRMHIRRLRGFLGEESESYTEKKNWNCPECSTGLLQETAFQENGKTVKVIACNRCRYNIVEKK